MTRYSPPVYCFQYCPLKWKDGKNRPTELSWFQNKLYYPIRKAFICLVSLKLSLSSLYRFGSKFYNVNMNLSLSEIWLTKQSLQRFILLHPYSILTVSSGCQQVCANVKIKSSTLSVIKFKHITKNITRYLGQEVITSPHTFSLGPNVTGLSLYAVNNSMLLEKYILFFITYQLHPQHVYVFSLHTVCMQYNSISVPAGPSQTRFCIRLTREDQQIDRHVCWHKPQLNILGIAWRHKATRICRLCTMVTSR